MNAAAGLLVLALLGPPPSRTYTWRDAAGQTHITSTPPPPGAVLVEPPPPPAIESNSQPRRTPVQEAAPTGPAQEQLSPAQQEAWLALEQHLARARADRDPRTLEAVADSLMSDSLWGHGLWIMPLVPILALALLGLLGWWVALGLGPGLRLPVTGTALLLGLALGHLLLGGFLYHPQAVRLVRNLELLEQHLGTGRPLAPAQRDLLRRHYRALEEAAAPNHLPWRFPAEVKALRAALKQVLVEP